MRPAIQTALIEASRGLFREDSRLVAQVYMDGLAGSVARTLFEQVGDNRVWSGEDWFPRGVVSREVFAAVSRASWSARLSWRSSLEKECA